MRVPTDEDGRFDPVEHACQILVGSRGEDPVVVRDRGAVEAEHRRAVVEGHFEGSRERADEVLVAVAEKARPPLGRLDELEADLVVHLGHAVQEARVPVAHDHGAPELADPGQRLVRLGADGDVAETDELVDPAGALDVLEHRVQRDAIAVDVGDQPDAHGLTSPRLPTPPQTTSARRNAS